MTEHTGLATPRVHGNIRSFYSFAYMQNRGHRAVVVARVATTQDDELRLPQDYSHTYTHTLILNVVHTHNSHFVAKTNKLHAPRKARSIQHTHAITSMCRVYIKHIIKCIHNLQRARETQPAQRYLLMISCVQTRARGLNTCASSQMRAGDAVRVVRASQRVYICE